MTTGLDTDVTVVPQTRDHFVPSVHWWDPIANLYETEPGTARIVPMEGLRGWAVLLVFFVHVNGAFKGYLGGGSFLFRLSDFLGTVGGTGVDLFFVISGYLIYGAVIRPKFRYGRFFRRRVQRIYPAFLGVFFLYIALWIFSSNDNFKFHGTFAQTVSYVLQNLLLVPGIFRVRAMNDVAWSLSYEMFFYLLLPLLLAVTRLRNWSRRGRISMFVALGIIGLLVSPLAEHPRIRLIGFLFGIVLFEVADRFRGLSTKFADLTALGGYAGGLALIYTVGNTDIVPGSFVVPLTALLAGVSSFAFCGLCFFGGGILSHIFSWQPLRALGNMSYSFYLIHGLALGVVREGVKRAVSPGNHNSLFLVLVMLGFAASWVASTLLFVAVERPLSIHIKMKRSALVSPPAAASYNTPRGSP
jgi:exopolysaccharide production protein ExoZ